jgi:hypothetical protein
MRKLVVGLGVALAIFGGATATSGLAHAGTDPRDGGVPTAPGNWVFAKWYLGSNSLDSFVRCHQDAAQLYPGRDHECRPWTADNTLRLWIKY